MHPSARHGQVELRRVSRVDEDRVELRAVRCPVLRTAGARAKLGVVVEAGHGLPRDAAVLRAEEPLR